MGKKIKVFVRRVSLLAVCMMFLSCSFMTVFAADEQTYGGVPASEWQKQLQDIFLESFTAVEPATLLDAVDFYREQGMDSVADIYEFWINEQPSLGEYVGFGEFTINQNEGVIDAIQVIDFENEKLEFEIVTNEATKTSDFFLRQHVEVKQDLAEVMARAGMNTLMGVGTVFVVLALMIILISLFKYVNVIEKAMTQKKEDKTETPDFVEQISQRESAEQNAPAVADTELIAVIAAAIAAATGDDTDSFVVRSIKRR